MLYVGQETAKPEESCWDPLALFACKEQWAPFAELLDSTYRARSSQDGGALQTMIWTLPSRLSCLFSRGRVRMALAPNGPGAAPACSPMVSQAGRVPPDS